MLCNAVDAIVAEKRGRRVRRLTLTLTTDCPLMTEMQS
jgi:hypothetical protein